jgi:hypothetical protein
MESKDMTNAARNKNNSVSIRQVGRFWMVTVQDTPSAQYPTVPRYHTAGVYYSEAEAVVLRNELVAVAA